MPYDRPSSTAGLGRIGVSALTVRNTHFNTFRNMCGDSNDLTTARWTSVNTTRAHAPGATTSNKGFPWHAFNAITRLTVTAGGPNSVTQTVIPGRFGARSCTLSAWVAIGDPNGAGPVSTSTDARIILSATGGNTQTYTFDINTVSGLINAQGGNGEAKVETTTFPSGSVGNQSTMMRISVAFENFNAQLTATTLQFITSVAGTAGRIAFFGGAQMAVTSNTLLSIGHPQTMNTAGLQTGGSPQQAGIGVNNTIYHSDVDLRAEPKIISANYVIDPYDDLGRTLVLTGNFALTFGQGVPAGWYCYLDTAQAPNWSLTNGGSAPMLVHGGPIVAFFGNFTKSNTVAPYNASFWKLIAENSAAEIDVTTTQDFNLIPLSSGANKQVFTGNGNFTWPYGVRTVWATAVGSGAGGGAGGATGGGGGGSSGVATIQQAIATGVAGTVYAVTVPAGGAAGANGAATSLGALLTVGGGLLGVAGGAAPGAGGASNGAGSSPGRAGGITALGYGGDGGSSALGGGGSGGAAVQAATVGAGFGAGGGGGQAPAGAAAAGAPGVLILEW